MIQGLTALLPIINKAVDLVPDKNKVAQHKADLEKELGTKDAAQELLRRAEFIRDRVKEYKKFFESITNNSELPISIDSQINSTYISFLANESIMSSKIIQVSDTK